MSYALYYMNELFDVFDTEEEAEEAAMEGASMGAVIEKENGDDRDLVEIERAEMAQYKVIEE